MSLSDFLLLAFFLGCAIGAALAQRLLMRPGPTPGVPQHFTVTRAGCTFPIEQLHGSGNCDQWLRDIAIILLAKWEQFNPKTALAPAGVSAAQREALQVIYFAVEPDIRANLAKCKTGHAALRKLHDDFASPFW